MNRRLLIFSLLPLLLLSACGDAKADGEGNQTYVVYYATASPHNDGVSVAGETRTLSGTADPVEELMALLLGAPTSAGLTASVPEGVFLKEWSLSEGVLHVALSEGYGGLSGIDLTIADYCITLTLCQLDDVRSVIISTDGELLPSRRYQALRSSDVLLSAMEDDPVYLAVTLYFPDAEGKGLVPEPRDVLTGGGTTRSAAVVKALIEGPKTEGLLSLMPEGTALLSAWVENGVCYVDFSAAFGEAPVASDRQGALLLYSIVNTLGRLSGVEEVQLLIEGEAPAFYGGVPALKPLEPDLSLLIK